MPKKKESVTQRIERTVSEKLTVPKKGQDIPFDSRVKKVIIATWQQSNQRHTDSG
jgi:hypothetical protein